MCYCKQREDRGVKDVMQVEFMVTSKLFNSDMSYTMSGFGKQKNLIEKSFDEMMLKNINDSAFRESQFVRTHVMMVSENHS